MTDSAAFHYARRVEFADTDMAGIAHFTSLLRYLEEAEHAYLRAAGVGVVEETAEGKISWPRVQIQCDFLQPARFGDVLEVAVVIAELGSRKVTYQFIVRRGETKIATGRTVAVCCLVEDHKAIRAIPIPEAIREKLVHCFGVSRGEGSDWPNPGVPTHEETES